MPPKGYNNTVERGREHGLASCPLCTGKGWNFTALKALAARFIEADPKPCGVCNGTGHVRAAFDEVTS